jgi:hypothetical protein
MNSLIETILNHSQRNLKRGFIHKLYWLSSLAHC